MNKKLLSQLIDGTKEPVIHRQEHFEYCYAAIDIDTMSATITDSFDVVVATININTMIDFITAHGLRKGVQCWLINSGIINFGDVVVILNDRYYEHPEQFANNTISL